MRFSRLQDDQIQKRLEYIASQENVHCADAPSFYGALCFVADGDLRQGINALQATANAFSTSPTNNDHVVDLAKDNSVLLTAEHVFRVCDQPHPELIHRMLADGCLQGNLDHALLALNELWRKGYAASDLVSTMFRVVKSMDKRPFPSQSNDSAKNKINASSVDWEGLQIELLKEIGMAQARILQGPASKLQLAGLLGALMLKACPPGEELYPEPGLPLPKQNY